MVNRQMFAASAIATCLREYHFQAFVVSERSNTHGLFAETFIEPCTNHVMYRPVFFSVGLDGCMRHCQICV